MVQSEFKHHDHSLAWEPKLQHTPLPDLYDSRTGNLPGLMPPVTTTLSLITVLHKNERALRYLDYELDLKTARQST